MSAKILFVDDEANILTSIERSFFGFDTDWDLLTATSGREALTILGTDKVDVLVTDIRMPGMNGIELLETVKKNYPHISRFVLTGQVDDVNAVRSINLAHQFLNKPSDPEMLHAMLARTIELRGRLAAPEVAAIATATTSLPSLPEIYEDLSRELDSHDPDIGRVGDILKRDMALSAKLLQIVNSAFFGLRNTVSDVTKAVSFLGLSTIRSLVLVNNLVAKINEKNLPEGVLLSDLTAHSLAVGTAAQAIAMMETGEGEYARRANTAGVLHDIGKLVFVHQLPNEYKKVLDISAGEDIPVDEAELRVFGTTHAEIGAYLLGLWGIPDDIVEAIAFHHRMPGASIGVINLPVILHVADYIVDHAVLPELSMGPAVLAESVAADRLYAARAGKWEERITAEIRRKYER